MDAIAKQRRNAANEAHLSLDPHGMDRLQAIAIKSPLKADFFYLKDKISIKSNLENIKGEL